MTAWGSSSTTAAGDCDVPHRLGLQIRAGIRVGEIETVGDDDTGVSVNISSRVASIADVSVILVSSTVLDLTPESGITFQAAGEHELKGVPDRRHLYPGGGL